jgi:hypothetical protein
MLQWLLSSTLAVACLVDGADLAPAVAHRVSADAVASSTCPFGGDPSESDFNPIALANLALIELLPDGRVADAYACHVLATAGIHPSQAADKWALAIEKNMRLLELTLGPRRPGSPRVYHNSSSKAQPGLSHPKHLVLTDHCTRLFAV